jgi:hypothetical protein
VTDVEASVGATEDVNEADFRHIRKRKCNPSAVGNGSSQDLGGLVASHERAWRRRGRRGPFGSRPRLANLR